MESNTVSAQVLVLLCFNAQGGAKSLPANNNAMKINVNFDKTIRLKRIIKCPTKEVTIT